jgi:ferrous-iron efflux pump FieF
MMAVDAHKAVTDAGLMRRAAIASLSVSVFLVTIKCFAYFTTGSVSVLASLADSALDLFTSALNLVAIKSALTPADHEHRFGHGKAEPLAGLAQGAFIAGSATFLIVQSVTRLLEPQPVADEPMALVIMGISIVLAIGLVMYQRFVVAQTGSVAIGADKVHYMGDVATNAGVIIALTLVWKLGWQIADPIIAILVAMVLLWSSWGVFRQSYDQLMDRELPDDERAKIKHIVMRHPEVRSMHDLRTRASGVNTFIQFHIELDPQCSLMRAHVVSDEVEHEVCTAFPRAEVIIHQDPEGAEPQPALATT